MVKGISYLLLMLCTAGGMAAMFVADRNVRKVKNQADYAKYYDVKVVLTEASIKQHNREKEAQNQTQTQAAPTRQTQVNMNVAARTQGGR